MIKVNIIGEQAWHVFVDKDGNEVKEECTVGEYNALAQKNPTNPTKEGYRWKFSYKDWKYATVSGRLEDNCYVVVNNKAVRKLPGKLQEITDASEVNKL